ncbi:MAG: urocanate hydratase [Synergistaceae bacterium]|jgi:urocanate hydratase|nr:urocanate hydratase [Synergistaceae bacterium]
MFDATGKALEIRLDFPNGLPPQAEFEPGIRRAPNRGQVLGDKEIVLALKNALRYIPETFHKELASEFLAEYRERGRIYGYRFRPQGRLLGKPIDEYKGKCVEAKAFQVMIDNNLDFDVALYPYELVTYGETGQVCQNWMQYLLIKKYLEIMTQDQTLVLQSGHPLGLFRSNPNAPRVILTNGLMVGLFDNPESFARAAALGVANYGQMTAGGWMYIGPQGIVHGTYNTLLNAGRKKFNLPQGKGLAGRLFISSGLGGMSGAQPKAADIAGAASIIADVDLSRIETRHAQGWVSKKTSDLAEAFQWVEGAMAEGEPLSVAYHGNVVDLLQYALDNDKNVDFLSDQTSCHAVYEGGYCPQGLTFEARTNMLKEDPAQFRKLVDVSLKKHYALIKALVAKGVYFFDYGNSFMRAVFDAGVKEIAKNGADTYEGFIFPSYVEDIMGPLLFDYGYGPFRWVCLSRDPEDLRKTDKVAMDCIDPGRRFQDHDNWAWIRDADKNKLVVGTQARILYQDEEGRMRIALKFNEMVRNGAIGPVMLGRDHHDVSGTDSPYRETANIKDGSNIMAEMAIQCFAGDCARGMSLVALHNGGGVGTGKAVDCGFGLVLDGSRRVDEIIRSSMSWDVISGVARRAWARNEHAIETIEAFNKNRDDGHITLPFIADEEVLERLVRSE